MRKHLIGIATFALVVSLVGTASLVCAEDEMNSREIIQTIQKELTVLGYDPGPADGSMGTKTRFAISKFEQANGMPVTGKATLAVAARISNEADKVRGGHTATAGGAAAAQAKEQARLECLKQKQAAQKKRDGWRALGNLGNRMLGRYGDSEIAATTSDAIATADDASAVAKQFGISESDAQECMR